MAFQLICPKDKRNLSQGESMASCPNCGQIYPVKDGVVCVLNQRDTFYEGAYENKVSFLPRSERIIDAWPIWLINSGYLWAVRKYIPAGSVVVELGCAGGVRYFGQRYRMIGCDLSFSSLKKTEFYEGLIQADATENIPLPDNSVDAVVSSYFFEHIAPAVKPRMLAEIVRILKPAGKLVFLYDVETNNPLIKHYKQIDPQRYSQLFLEGDGHVGYQLPLKNMEIFKASGFDVASHEGFEKTFFQSPAAYEKLSRFASFLKPLFVLGSKLGAQPFFYLYTLFIRLLDCIVCPWLPSDWARMDLIVCVKK